MHHNCPPELISLYNRAIICQRFPAYTFEALDHVSAPRILKVLDLMSLAETIQRKG